MVIKEIVGKRGFTLLELLMVVIVLGVLAALMLPQYQGFVEKARAAEGINTIGAIKSGEALYKMENGSYVDCADAAAISTNLGVTVPPAANALWTYAVSGAGAATYVVTATRTANKAGGQTGATIIMTWTDAGGAVWGGTHTGRPR